MDREKEVESGALANGAVHADLAAEPLHRREDLGYSQSGPGIPFGREKRIEYVSEDIRGHARAIVPYTQANIVADCVTRPVRQPRANSYDPPV
ncbi:MAG TPA: hypothetical protein VFS69_02090, partial [Sphingomicrobium sp.]|nr:hypothetical protein [Sphingomicrobium sp.]